jgi:hypothetical protein
MEPYTEKASHGPCTADLEESRLETVLRMTLLLSLEFPGPQTGLWMFKTFMNVMCVAGLLYPPVARRAAFWLWLSIASFALRNVYNWAYTDNHVALYSYWYLALGCALSSRAPMAILALNARLMIGLVFMFATLQKLLSPEFIKGDSVTFFLLHDRRFFSLAQFAGIHADQCAAVRSSMEQLVSSIDLPVNARLKLLAMSLTWWTVLVESVIALSFLVPRSPRLRAYPDLALFVFVLTTFPVAPVIGFAWILLTMGYSQCPAKMKKVMVAYQVIFILAVCFGYPQFRALLAQLASLSPPTRL